MNEATCVEQNLGLVRSLALKIVHTYRFSSRLDDLYSFGQEGLLDACRKFDPQRGYAFSTYAYYRIRGAIFDGCRSMGWIKRAHKTRFAADAAFNDHQHAHYEDRPAIPPPTHLAQDLDSMLCDAANIFLLADADVADPSPNAEESLTEHQENHWIRQSVARLPEEDRTIIEMSFFDNKSLDEIGVLLGCSKSWVCRRRAVALTKLRQYLCAN